MSNDNMFTKLIVYFYYYGKYVNVFLIIRKYI